MTQPVQERGRRRRDTLLDAAVELLAEGGFAAVSHRAVAERAGLPLAATTYYFKSRDHLIAAAFELMVDRDLATTRARFTARIGQLDVPSGASTGGPADGRADEAAGGPTDGPTGGAAPRMSALAAAEALAAALLPRDETERLRHLALWELYLQAGREPALRPLARAWSERCGATTSELLRIAGYPATEMAVLLLGSALDGLEIEAIVEARPNSVRSMVEVLSRALEWIHATEEG